jgi:hypothetical protein
LRSLCRKRPRLSFCGFMRPARDGLQVTAHCGSGLAVSYPSTSHLDDAIMRRPLPLQLKVTPLSGELSRKMGFGDRQPAHPGRKTKRRGGLHLITLVDAFDCQEAKRCFGFSIRRLPHIHSVSSCSPVLGAVPGAAVCFLYSTRSSNDCDGVDPGNGL